MQVYGTYISYIGTASTCTPLLVLRSHVRTKGVCVAWCGHTNRCYSVSPGLSGWQRIKYDNDRYSLFLDVPPHL